MDQFNDSAQSATQISSNAPVDSTQGRADAVPASSSSPYPGMYYRFGRWQLATYVWDNEWYSNTAVMSGLTYQFWYDTTMRLLLSTEDWLLSAILEGSVYRAGKRHARTAGHLEDLLHRAQGRPSHYMYEFVDSDGVSPSKAMLNTIGEIARRYASSDPDAWETVRVIDKFVDPDGEFDEEAMRQGPRRYLPDATTRSGLTQLLENMSRVSGGGPDATSDEMPLRRPLRTTGYTHTPYNELRAHARHQANRLMCLFEAISQAALGWDFTNRRCIISLCSDKA